MAGGKLFLCRGRGPERGKYRGLVQTMGTLSPEGKSIFWGKETQEVALPESAVLECENDPEIVIVRVREMSAEEAAEHVQGPVAAQQAVDISMASAEQLQAEMARRGIAPVAPNAASPAPKARAKPEPSSPAETPKKDA